MAEDADYGTDVSMFVDGEGPPDLDPYFREITGAEAIAQQTALRCYTPRYPTPGYLVGAEGHGVFLPDFTQAALKQENTFLVQRLVQAEVGNARDERIAAAKVTVMTDVANQQMIVDIAGTSDEGPFELTLAVTDVTVELLNQDQ